MTTVDTLKYPIGRFRSNQELTSAERNTCISEIEACPALLEAAVQGLSADQLQTPYREGGWTVQQLVHHIFDSHVNAYIRFRLALTETNPRITAYKEAEWAKLSDSERVPASVSLALVKGLHLRWVVMLNSMSDNDFARTLDHPENGLMTLNTMVQLYAWHGKHHVRHITALRERMGW